jgi:protein TonB
MGEVIRWRKATVISLLLHVVLLTVIGLMITKTVAMQEVPEQYIELELDSGIPKGDGRTENSAIDAAANNKVSAMPAAMSQSDTLVTAKEQTPSVVTPAHSLSVLAAEPSTQSIGASDASTSQEGGVGAGTTSGNSSGSGSELGTGTGAGEGGGGRSGNGVSGISSPSILSQVEPVYPNQSRQAGQEGTVVLKIQILENGRSGNVSVYQSSGWDVLDDAAIDAVEQWRFVPAKKRESGQAIVCYITLPVVFRLKT